MNAVPSNKANQTPLTLEQEMALEFLEQAARVIRDAHPGFGRKDSEVAELERKDQAHAILERIQKALDKGLGPELSAMVKNHLRSGGVSRGFGG